jgi:hypothetical protein
MGTPFVGYGPAFLRRLLPYHTTRTFVLATTKWAGYGIIALHGNGTQEYPMAPEGKAPEK